MCHLRDGSSIRPRHHELPSAIIVESLPSRKGPLDDVADHDADGSAVRELEWVEVATRRIGFVRLLGGRRADCAAEAFGIPGGRSGACGSLPKAGTCNVYRASSDSILA
jgi:hypothetical protein